MTMEGDDSDGGDLEEVGSSQHTDIDEYSEFFATPPTRRPDGSGQSGEALGSSSAEGAESARRPRSRTPSPVRSESAAKRQKRVTWVEHKIHDGEGGRAAQQDKRQREVPDSSGDPGPSTKATKAQEAAGQATAASQCLKEAFETLSDAHQRREHDEELRRKEKHRKKGGRYRQRRRR
jgi:hypothetical protein